MILKTKQNPFILPKNEDNDIETKQNPFTLPKNEDNDIEKVESQNEMDSFVVSSGQGIKKRYK